MPPGVLEAFSAGIGRPATEEREAIDAGVTPAEVVELARRLKGRGMTDPKAIYDAILLIHPGLAKVPQDQVLDAIVNA